MKELKVTVRIRELPDENQIASNEEKSSPQDSMASTNPLGLKVKALTSDLAKKYNVDMTDGVIVTYVDKNSLAAQSGIQEGDIITSIEEQTITNPKQFQDAIKNVDMKKGIIVHLISDGTAKFEVLKASED
jgi:serine protease Do